MDASKFSNFSIDYILGENSGANTHPAEGAGAPQVFRGEYSEVDMLPPGGFNPQVSVMGLHSQCPGVYDSTPLYSTFPCCGPVTYYQAFNMSYCSPERWIHHHTDCDRDEAQQRQRNRIRTVFTENQMKQLDQLFSITEYPSVQDRAQLAKATGLSEETVRVWFKNRRARRKRQKPTPVPHQADLV
ncbi:dharma [Hoplias malabaricus]|uniref:dharma n=1 Tax=Hoplias malabaricus TaxID=27720 RepID=UPI003462E7AF